MNMQTNGSSQTDSARPGPFGLLIPWRADERPTVDALIERVRRRWRLRRLLQGLTLALALGSLVFAAAAWMLNFWHFSPPAVWGMRLLVLTAMVALLLQFCLKPLRQRVDDARVALYLEEHETALDGLLSSAVDARRADARQVSPLLAQRLAEQAIDTCRELRFGDTVEAGKLNAATTRLGLVVLALVLLAIWPPQFLRFGAPALLIPWTGAAEYSPYRIELTPGNIEIARGGDQLINARIEGFDGNGVTLFTSRDGGHSWQRTEMAVGSESGVYESYLFDIGNDLDYYVAGAGRQSPVYRISVAEIPALEKIGLRYHFPAYTMLAPETTFGSGDISALEGTRVEVLITPTIEIPGGELLFADGRRVDLRKAGDGSWIGDLNVDREAVYRVRLQRSSGVAVDASPDYQISVLDDRHPSVSILSPGRDTKVSMVEEPLMRIRASDDQGIADLQLVMSINGGAEQVVDLLPQGNAAGAGREVEAEHVLFLEQLNLQPGDLISYYVRARDLAPETQDKTATSDIFFYQVRPFSTHYRSAQQQGSGGGGGQGGEQQGHLSEQQKQFVVATFKMIRDRDTYADEAWTENLELLATAEARIRDRVEAIVRRIGSRPIVQTDERYQVVLTELPQAAEAMIEVEKLLREAEIEPALTDAQRALLHLQRADAAFREINVQLSRQGGGGGRSSSSNNELADLFRLEMDKLRNQYETVQRSQQRAPDQVIDETLERLKELARRQQQEVERQLRRRDQSRDGGGDSRQQALADELEEMARQLERLTREQRTQRMQQSIAQMRKAAEAMRRAAQNAAGGGGAGDARAAEQSLREARRLLDQGRVQQFSEAVEQSLRRAELAEKKQAAIKREVAEMKDGTIGSDLDEQLDRLQQRKQGLSEELSKLEGELGQLTGEAGDEQPKAAESLKRALRAGRENRLQDRIGRTRTMVQLGEKRHAIANEQEIQKGIAEVRRHIEKALAEVGEPDERGLERSLEEMRDLARELRFSRERAAAAGNPGRGGSQAGGSQAAGGSANGGSANGSGGYAVTGLQPLWQDLDNIAKRARELGHRLAEQGIDPGDIDPVLARIEQLTRAGDPSSSTGLHDDALLALMELEYRLRQEIDGDELPELMVSEPSEISEEYGDMVADYFRRLSRP